MLSLVLKLGQQLYPKIPRRRMPGPKLTYKLLWTLSDSSSINNNNVLMELAKD